MAAEEIRPGCAAYNLGRLEALEGNAEEALDWMRQLVAAGLPLSKSDIAQETDFDRVRNAPVFQSFVESLPAGGLADSAGKPDALQTLRA
jgi:hypothetical protein